MIKTAFVFSALVLVLGALSFIITGPNPVGAMAIIVALFTMIYSVWLALEL